MRSFALLLLLAAPLSLLRAQDYDVVVANGRVIDPESGLDGVRNVGIRSGHIAAISEQPLRGKRTIDAKGLVVAPGFIDLHQHGQDDENYRYAALDGVTTALEMEVGTGDVDAWYRQHGPSRLINYGVSIGHIPVRMKVMGDSGNLLPSGPGGNRIATAAQVNEMARMINAGFDAGALGLGLGPAYTPAASNWEVLEMFRVAGQHHASAHIHVREGPIGDPEGNAPGMEEAVAAALSTGTPLHIVHVNSVSYFAIGRTLALLRGARAHGLDVTWEAYPYSASMTEIESALFDDWGDRPDSDYQKLEWPQTGERLTRASFQAKRKEGGIVIMHDNTDANDAIAVGDSLTMIASDGFMHQGKGHPRATGTYARVLGHFVREANAFSLSAAIRKMSLMPAQRLQKRAPAFARKGRVKVGADADLAIFDPAQVIDRSTYQQPALPPEGIVHVLVNGSPVVSVGKIVPNVAPGRPMRAPKSQA